MAEPFSSVFHPCRCIAMDELAITSPSSSKKRLQATKHQRLEAELHFKLCFYSCTVSKLKDPLSPRTPFCNIENYRQHRIQRSCSIQH
ncbi:hypothetical protein AGOR_G00240760 [Albula goreensis]|uniref:Uncharacterized protein n=1 Tax=Albula goreensis TaxID=1534307 RepID=A0A8T3CIV2_9TELE|nr:hypothetical protein AGOR_G00240760 [Albula goreensis]